MLLSLPMIYGCALPFLLVDLFVSFYQATCFPIYGIPKVRRADYIVFDRGKLAYLNIAEKIGCIYCSYANGLLAWVREIAARTEQRFCPIRHARSPQSLHSRYSHFLPYGDAKAWRTTGDKVSKDFVDVKDVGPSR